MGINTLVKLLAICALVFSMNAYSKDFQLYVNSSQSKLTQDAVREVVEASLHDSETKIHLPTREFYLLVEIQGGEVKQDKPFLVNISLERKMRNSNSEVFCRAAAYGIGSNEAIKHFIYQTVKIVVANSQKPLCGR